jgi:hypothetical protein
LTSIFPNLGRVRGLEMIFILYFSVKIWDLMRSMPIVLNELKLSISTYLSPISIRLNYIVYLVESSQVATLRQMILDFRDAVHCKKIFDELIRNHPSQFEQRLIAISHKNAFKAVKLGMQVDKPCVLWRVFIIPDKGFLSPATANPAVVQRCTGNGFDAFDF